MQTLVFLVLCNSCAPHCCSKQQTLGDTSKVSADWSVQRALWLRVP
jgi:hypothetical protein